MLLKVFLRTLLVLLFKCCYYNIIVPIGHLKQPPVTQKRLPSLAFENDFQEMNAGELPEVTATAGGCSDCWKLRHVAGMACNMTENAIFIFPNNSNKLRPQTESCIFSDVVARRARSMITSLVTINDNVNA